MTSNSIRRIVDTLRRRDGGNAPDESWSESMESRTLMRFGWWSAHEKPTATMVQQEAHPATADRYGRGTRVRIPFVALKARHGLDGSDSG